MIDPGLPLDRLGLIDTEPDGLRGAGCNPFQIPREPGPPGGRTAAPGGRRPPRALPIETEEQELP